MICEICGIVRPKLTSNVCTPCKNKPNRGFCRECGKPSYSVKKKLCGTCFTRYIRMEPFKIKCHDILGWECICCKRNDVNMLKIDHIEPITGKQIPLKRTYNDIISMGIKAHKKYQILCHFCNTSKKRNDKCTINHKYDLNNLREAISHMKELGVKDLDNIKIPKTI